MKTKVLFSRTYEVIIDEEQLGNYVDAEEKARWLVVDGDPSVTVGALEFDGYEDVEEE